MSDDKNNNDNKSFASSVDGLHSHLSDLDTNVNTVSASVDSLTKDVTRNTDLYAKLAAEQNSLANKVNQIDMRITVIEETSRIQNRHNEGIHDEFKNGLNKLENSLDTLISKIDKNGDAYFSSIRNIETKLTNHTIEKEKWQTNIYRVGMILAGSALLAVLGFLARWAFITLTAAPMSA